MNRSYRLIWNAACGAWVAVAECVRGRGKSSKVSVAAAFLAVTSMAHAGTPGATQLPTGAQVVAGQAGIAAQGSTMTITQGSARAAIDWQRFDIGSAAIVNFLQPSSSSVALNRVLSSDASQIFGHLNANGQVFLSNPNGVYFSPTARVDVGGLVATTHAISTDDFMAGRDRFTRNGATGSVTNDGTLNASQYIALLAPEVRNSGVVAAHAVALAAGETFELQFDGAHGLNDVRVEPATIRALVDNGGAVLAPGGTILLSAQAVDHLQGGVVKMSGRLEASALVNDGGTIRLAASDEIAFSGRAEANGGAQGKGGTVSVIASLDNRESTTDFNGSISARGGTGGGFIETSGSHLTLGPAAQVDTRADQGKTGLWLIDPYDYTIGASEATTLTNALASSDVTVTTAADAGPYGSNGNAGSSGNITVNSAISAAALNALTLTAANAININAPVSAGALRMDAPGGINLAANLAAQGNITLNGNLNLVTDASIISGLATTFTSFTDYVVPAGATSLTAMLVGGAGGAGGNDGNNRGGVAGMVGTVTATLSVTPGDHLYIAPGGAGTAGLSNVANKGGGAGGTNAFGLASGGKGGDTGTSGHSGGGGGGGAATLLSLDANPTSSSALLVAGGAGGGGGSGNNAACPNLCAGENGSKFRTDGSMDGAAGPHAGNQSRPIQDGGASGGGGGGINGGVANASVYFVNEWTGRGANTGQSGAANGLATTGLSTSRTAVAAGSGGYAEILTGGGTVTLNGTVNGAHALSVEALNGNVVLGGAVGNSAPPTGLSISGSNGIAINGGSVVTSGPQTFLGPITLGSNNTALNSNGGTITLGGDVSNGGGAGNLSVSAGSGDVEALGKLGSSGAPLGTLAIDSTGTTSFGDAVYAASLDKTGAGLTQMDGGLVQTSGGQSYGGGLGLGGATVLSSTGSGDISVAGAISNSVQSDLSIAAADGNINLGGNLAVGTNSYGPTPIGNVSLTASGSVNLGTPSQPISVDAKSLNINAGSTSINAATSTFTCGGVYAGSGICTTDGASFNVDTSSTFAGPLSGPGSLTKDGSGQLGMTGKSTFTGDAHVNDGVLELGGSGQWGNGAYAGNIDVGSQIRFASSADQVFSGTMSGPGFINSLSTGTLKISTLADAPEYNTRTVYLLITPDSGNGSSSIYGDLTPSFSAHPYGSLDGSTPLDPSANLSGTATLAGAPSNTSNVGSYTVDYASGLSIGSERYTHLQSVPAPWAITPRELTVSGITAANKVYNQGTDATLDLSQVLLNNRVNNDVVMLASGASGSFADANAGNGKTVNIGGLALSGPGAGNYTLASAPVTTTANITPAPISAVTGITAGDKVYDSTTGATLQTGSAGFTGVYAGDSLNVASANGNFADKNAGPGKQVNITGLTLGGTSAGNYMLVDTGASTTATITPATISAITGINAADRSYNGGTDATLDKSAAQFTGMFGGDVLNVASGTGAFADKNVGQNKPVNISGLSLGGADAGNYTLASTTASSTASISPAVIANISGIAAQDKVYDSTTSATLQTGLATFNGVFAGDDLTVASASASFADKNAGSGKSVAISGLTLGGSSAGNYTLADATASTTASITPASIAAITGITATDRVYDGSTAATLNNSAAHFIGLLGGDVLTVASGTGSFADKNAGSAKPVHIDGLSLGGADAGNYTLASTEASSSANITPATISAVTGITAGNKVYDASTHATLMTSGAQFIGMVAGDQLSTATAVGSFADKNVGAGKSVSITGLSLSGSSAGNYTLADTTASATATITPATISTITGITAADRVYDGGTAATLNSSAAQFNGKFSGDVLSVASASGAFADKNAGHDKPVNIGGLSLGGADAGNYTLAQNTAQSSASISPAVIANISGITTHDKVYDASTTATLVSGGAQFVGIVAGDQLNVATAVGNFADKNAGTGKQVNINGLSLGGADAGNYTLANSTASSSANIGRAVIENVSGIATQDRVYDGTTGATLATGNAHFNGLLGNDALTVASANGSFADKNAAQGKPVSVSDIVLGGADAGNYTLANITANSSGNISPAVIANISGITAQDKVYDALTHVDLSTQDASFKGIVAGDQLTVATAAGNLADKNAGSAKQVNISGLTLGGADAGNYTLASSTASGSANVGRATLSSVDGITALDKVYDGTPDARLATGNAHFNGRQGNDALTVASAEGSFDNAHVGLDKPVLITSIVLGGADAGNYQLQNSTAMATANIDRAVDDSLLPRAPSAPVPGPLTSTTPAALTLSLPAIMQTSDTNRGIVVSLTQPPSAQVQGAVTVSVPKDIANAGSFSFPLPEHALGNASADTHIEARLVSGSPLPSWIHFDRATRSFSVQAGPDRAFPLHVLLITDEASSVVTIYVEGS